MRLDIDLAAVPGRFLETLDLQAALVIARARDWPTTVALFAAIRDAIGAETRRRGLNGLARPIHVVVDLGADTDPETVADDLRRALGSVVTARDSGGTPEPVRAVWGEIAGDLTAEIAARRRRRDAEDVALGSLYGVRAG